jgi:hypothetical protein
MAMFTDQLKQFFRWLGSARLFTLYHLFTLAIDVGANTVIFSVVEGVLLTPLLYPRPEQLIGVWHIIYAQTIHSAHPRLSCSPMDTGRVNSQRIAQADLVLILSNTQPAAATRSTPSTVPTSHNFSEFLMLPPKCSRRAPSAWISALRKRKLAKQTDSLLPTDLPKLCELPRFLMSPHALQPNRQLPRSQPSLSFVERCKSKCGPSGTTLSGCRGLLELPQHHHA